MRVVLLQNLVHKKYTYKDGKKYGPYYYETKRVDGKVVTKYLGKDSYLGRKRTNFVLPILFLLIMVIFIGSVFYFNPNLTGYIVDDSVSSSDSGEDSGNSGNSENYDTADREESNNGIDSDAVQDIDDFGDSTENSNEEITQEDIFISDVESANSEPSASSSGSSKPSSDIFSDLEHKSELQIQTIQGVAILYQPVKWIKKIDIVGPAEISFEIPVSAFNVTINRIPKENKSDLVIAEGDEEPVNDINLYESELEKVSDHEQEEVAEEISELEVKELVPEIPSISFDITGSVVAENPSGNVDFKRFFEWFKSLIRITGFIAYEDSSSLTKEIVVKIDETEQGILLEYETPAPYIIEEKTSQGKAISVIGPEDVVYENVSVLSELDEDFNVKSSKEISIYWENADNYLDFEKTTDFEDADLNGIYDNINWIIPSLSGKETFLIIVITRAEHLDQNRTFISNIFDEVRELDGNWSEEIPDGNYVRITFEKNLTSNNDITIFPRIVSGNPEIEVYEIDENETIAKFDVLNENEYNKVFLTNLIGMQDSFDLHIQNGSVEFDHIVDPQINVSVETGIGTNVTLENNFSHLSLNDPNLIIYTPFDDNVSTAVVYDYSGNNYDGVISGDTYASISPYGFGYSFDGINELASDEDEISFSGLAGHEMYNNSFSLSFWLNKRVSTATQLIIGTESTNNARGWSIRIQGGDNIRFVSDNGTSGVNVAGNTNTDPNVWYNAVYVYNHTDSNFTFYLNGVSTESEIIPQTGGFGNGNPTYLGKVDGSAGSIFNGTLDEFMIFNKTLIASEVSAIYNNQSVRFFPRGTQTFDEINVSGNGDENRVNVTIDEILNFDNENFTVQVGDSGAGAYTYGTEALVVSGEANNIDFSTPNNISVRVVFYPDTGRFFTPILKGNVSLDSFTEVVNTAPGLTGLVINSTDLSNKTLQDLHCSASLIDNDADTMNVTVWWFNNSIQHLKLDYNNSYANGTFFMATLESQNTTKHQNWSCGFRAFDGLSYGEQINSSELEILNSFPTTIALSAPAVGIATTDRTPTFSRAITLLQDDDNDAITYELNISCYHLAGGGCSGKGEDNRYVTSLTSGQSTTGYEIIGDLQYFYDNQYYYNWTMRSFDGEEGVWVAERNFNLTSSVSITLLNDSVNFGVIGYQSVNDTTDNSPLPFLIENNGNAFVNISIDATSLWNSILNPNRYFQFKADNYTLENGSFSWLLSRTIFTNISLTGDSSDLAIALLNYTSSTNTAEIDTNISVPDNEGSDVRSSTVTFTASLTE